MGVSQVPAAFQSKRTQTITSSSTWTVPIGVNSVDVTCIGAGAAIGGAGAVVKSTINTSSLQGTGISATIGASPTPGSYGAGGDTSFGSHITAGGGFAGDPTNAPSGTRFISGRSIPACPILRPFISTYGNGESSTSSIVYNSSIGLYVTGMTNYFFGAGTASYYTSSNLTSWTRRSLYVPGAPRAIYSSNNRLFQFFAYTSPTSVGYITSSDGINWSSAIALYPSGSADTANHDVMYSSTSNKYYFLSGITSTQAMYISEIAAANVATTVASLVVASSVTDNYGTTGFLHNGSNLGIVFLRGPSATYYSTFNGTTWSAFGNASSLVAAWVTAEYPTSGVWDGSKFVIVTNTGLIYTSTNGTTWTSTGTTVSGLNIKGWTGTYYYGHLSSANVVVVSTNGTTWTRINMVTSSPNQTGQMNRINNSGNVLISVGNVGSNGGCIETYDLANPNTTIEPGIFGRSGISGGGAGGSVTYGVDSASGFRAADAPGIDGYGINLALGPYPAGYGSSFYNNSNYGMGNQGAVILEWMQ